MRDSKRRARLWIAEVTKTKTRSTGSTRQKTVVPKPPSQVLYILPLWEKPSHMERVAVDCDAYSRGSSCMGSGTEVFKHKIILKSFELFENPLFSGRINLSSHPNLQHPPEHGQTRRQTRCSFSSPVFSMFIFDKYS